MSPNGSEKRAYYARPEVVDGYDAWRFGSPGGRHVDAVEQDAVRALLRDVPRDGRVLDMPSGTGRLLSALVADGFGRVVAADASPGMAARSRAVIGRRVSRQDAFATGFRDGSFDVVVSVRFLFHVEDPDVLFREVRRLLRPGGAFVFDTIRWTPRGLVPPVDRRLGGRIHARGEREIARVARRHGLTVVDRRRVLALPSLAYRFLPAPVVTLLAAAERRVPDVGFTKTFFLARADPM